MQISPLELLKPWLVIFMAVMLIDSAQSQVSFRVTSPVLLTYAGDSAPYHAQDRPSAHWAYPSVTWKSGHLEREIGIFYYRADTPVAVQPGLTEESDLGMTFDLRRIAKAHETLIPFIGGGARLFYYQGSYEPFTTRSYPERNTSIGVTCAFKPGIRLNIGKHLLIETSIEFANVSLARQKEEVDNPILLERQRITRRYAASADFFSRFLATAGIRF